MMSDWKLYGFIENVNMLCILYVCRYYTVYYVLMTLQIPQEKNAVDHLVWTLILLEVLLLPIHLKDSSRLMSLLVKNSFWPQMNLTSLVPFQPSTI